MSQNFSMESVSGSDAKPRDLERNASENSLECSNSQTDQAFENSNVTLSKGDSTGEAKVGSTPLCSETIEIHSDVDPSTRNPTGGTAQANQNQEVVSTSLSIETIEKIRICFCLHCSNQAICCKGQADVFEPTTHKHMVPQHINCFKNISSMKCNSCGNTTHVNPWYMFGEYEKDAKEDIFRFLRHQNQSKTLWHCAATRNAKQMIQTTLYLLNKMVLVLSPRWDALGPNVRRKCRLK